MENQENKMDMGADYQEIDLRDVIRILLKRKKMILGLALAAAAIAAIIGNQTPEKYRAEIVVEVGNLAINKDIRGGGSIAFAPIESPANIKEKIEKGVFSVQANQKIDSDPAPAIKASFAANTNIIVISGEGDDPEKTKNYLVAIAEAIIADHQKKSENFSQSLGLVKTSETAVIKSPQHSAPIQSKILINVIAAAIAGLFLGIFWALAANWWRAKSL